MALTSLVAGLTATYLAFFTTTYEVEVIAIDDPYEYFLSGEEGYDQLPRCICLNIISPSRYRSDGSLDRPIRYPADWVFLLTPREFDQVQSALSPGDRFTFRARIGESDRDALRRRLFEVSELSAQGP